MVVGVDALASVERACSVTVGTFDGVHQGHRALISRAVSEARARDLAAAVVTWDRHPLQTLRPDVAPPLLSSQERKVELLSELRVDYIAVLPFDHELSTWSPERFVTDVLVAGLHARVVSVGKGWRFGHRAAGNVALLTTLGAELGFETHEIELASSEEVPVSSSRIRAAIAQGNLETATALLGRPFDLDAVVVRGDGRGRSLGFPTANLDADPALVRPPIGVYAGRAGIAQSSFGAAISVGVNPQFGGEVGVSPVRIEMYVLDFSGDLYGEKIRLEFWKRLRDELTFPSVDDLVLQMGRDVEETRRLVPGLLD